MPGDSEIGLAEEINGPDMPDTKPIDAATLRKVLGNFGEVLPQVRCDPAAFLNMAEMTNAERHFLCFRNQ